MKHLNPLFAIVFLVSCLSSSQADINNVPDEYDTIQDAIDAAEDGDTVLVQPGEYVENIDFDGKEIVVGSLFLTGRDEDYVTETIIDGNEDGSVVRFGNEEGEDAVLIGFTIRNGESGGGGGVYSGPNSNPTISYCTISDNDSNLGGGIFCGESSSPAIDNCTISGNSAQQGGGIFCGGTDANPSISNCTITDNSSWNGGGILCMSESNPTITNCIISDNSAFSLGNSGEGGGIFCEDIVNPVITDCVIIRNSSNRGGGIICGWGGSATISGCLIGDNSASLTGGGIYCHDFNLDITICTITGNSSDDDSGGGIFCSNNSDINISNTILWNDTPQEIYFSADDQASSITVSYSNVQNGEEGIVTNDNGDVEWGEGNIDEDPLFVNPDEGDYHLTDDSPCIDVGDPDSPEDPDDTRADMGAFYFHQEEEDEPEIREVGFYDTPGNAKDVFVVGDMAYVVDLESGLRVIDVSDPENPEEVGFYDTPDGAIGIFVVSDFAYVADRDAGLRVIDLSDPENPDEVGFYDTPDEAMGIFVSGDLAYVGDQIAGLRVIDISDPENPDEVGFYDTPGYAFGVFASGDMAYVADGGQGLRVIDVSDPENPDEVGFYVTPGEATDVFVAGDLAYMADKEEGLRVIDVSDPENPDEIGFYDTPGFAYGVFAAGDMAYVADNVAGLRVIDVSDPENPDEVGFYDTPGVAWGVFVAGNLAYVADGGSGLRILDVSDFIVGGVYVPHFAFTDFTGNNHSFLIEDVGLAPEYEIGEEDEIGIFRPNGMCVGASFWTGEITGLVAWADDEWTEDTVDGFIEEETFYFRYWDSAGEQILEVGYELLEGDEVFRIDGITWIALNTSDRLDIDLRLGWNMISSNVVPVDSDLRVILESIIDNVFIIKNAAGRFSIPPLNFWGLSEWDSSQGYQIRVTAESILPITGTLIPVDTPIHLRRGWSMIAYYPEMLLAERVAFANVVDILFLAKNWRGRFYRPPIDFSNMDDLEPGQGYQVRMTEGVDFVWNIEGDNVNAGSRSVPTPLMHFPAVLETAANMSILVKSVPISGEDFELGCFSEDGLCVGSVSLSGTGPWGMAVWEDDLTTEIVDGTVNDEPLAFRLWNGKSELMVQPPDDLPFIYTTDDFIAVSLDETIGLPTEFTFSAPYPNPFNSMIRFQYTLDREAMTRLLVYDITGRMIEVLTEKQMHPGWHTTIWDARGIPSGIYFARLTMGEEAKSVKMTLIK